MRNRRRLLRMQRDRLVHVFRRLRVSGVCATICAAAKTLSEYEHVALHETPMYLVDPAVVSDMQLSGLELLQTDKISCAALERLNGSGAVLYNMTGCPGLGRVIPSIYYSYGVFDPEIDADIAVPCSEYAAGTDRNGASLCLDRDMATSPFIDVRGLRHIAGRPGPYTIGLLSTDSHGKYPYDLATTLVRAMPSNVTLLLTPPEHLRGTRLAEALEEDKARPTPAVKLCPPRPDGILAYTAQIDTLVHGTADGYCDPCGRTAIEAMALGKALVCERRGRLGFDLIDRVHTLFFDTREEAARHALFLRTDTDARRQLAANGQLWAAGQDIGVATMKLKRTLRMIGA